MKAKLSLEEIELIKRLIAEGHTPNEILSAADYLVSLKEKVGDGRSTS